jgi:hypothetical protein
LINLGPQIARRDIRSRGTPVSQATFPRDDRAAWSGTFKTQSPMVAMMIMHAPAIGSEIV